MQIGAMNHPGTELLSEIKWMAEMDLDFVDLTLEPPLSAAWHIDPAAVRAMLQGHGLGVIGHTAYYLPIANPFESVRRAAVEEIRRCIQAFAEVGVKWMNIHPDRYAPLHEWSYVLERNLQSLRELLAAAQDAGLGVMIENIPGKFNDVEQLSELLDPLPELGLHLDIGHANLMVEENTTAEILAEYGDRLRHVHLHDNKGGSADLHLPLGCGIVDFKQHLKELHATGYDGTITLEVFSPDRHYLQYSRDVLRRTWDQFAAHKPEAQSAPRRAA